MSARSRRHASHVATDAAASSEFALPPHAPSASAGTSGMSTTTTQGLPFQMSQSTTPSAARTETRCQPRRTSGREHRERAPHDREEWRAHERDRPEGRGEVDGAVAV